jgi:multidrug resistance efflux pump
MKKLEQKSRIPSGKWWRRGGGVLIFLTVAVVVVPAVLNQQSGQAVVNAPVLSVHSPISGTVQDFNTTAGQLVASGARLGRVLSLRARESLENELLSLKERQQGLQSQQTEWQLLQKAFEQRAQLHADHEQTRLQAQLAEVDSQARAQQAQLRQDADTLARQERLASENFISPLQIDAARNALQASQARLEAIQAREKMLRIEGLAVRDRVYLGQGRNDVPYSQQKLEDLRIQMAELKTRLRETQSRVQQIQSQLDQGEGGQQALQEAPIHAPVQGLLWRKFFANGSEVMAGAELGQVIHCRDAFVDVAAPESQLHAMAPGTVVQYRLLGTRDWLQGKVRATSGSGNNGVDLTLAAQPRRERNEGRVLVDIRPEDLAQPEAHLCYAGRVVDVKIPRSWNPLALFSRLSVLGKI